MPSTCPHPRGLRLPFAASRTGPDQSSGDGDGLPGRLDPLVALRRPGMDGAGRGRSMLAFRSVASVLVRFVGRSFSTSLCATRRHLTGWDERPASGLSQQPGEAGGSLTLEAQGRVGAAPTTTGRVGTARRPGPASKTGRCTDCRNQWWNPRKRETGSKAGGLGPGSSARPPSSVGGRLGAGCGCRPGGHGEGLRRSRGEAAGEELGTDPVDRLMVKVGTVLGPPSPPAVQAGGGQARRRLLVLGGDGAAVVVGGRESRPHGQGRQRVRSRDAGMPEGRR